MATATDTASDTPQADATTGRAAGGGGPARRGGTRGDRALIWVHGHRHLPDGLGLLWVLVAAVLVLTPALVHGYALGPYDLLSNFGLTSVRHPSIHNTTQGDQIQLFIPWTRLVWEQVHHGQLPLWNPYNALGMPLAFNWESAPFSLPVVIGYLVPENLSFTVQLVVILFIAGTGVYMLGKVLRLSVLGCVMAATVFELSGPFIGWLGWPLSAVMSWAGWLVAAAMLIVRGRQRSRSIVFGAVVLALAFYAGDPEGSFLLLLGTGVVVLVIVAHRMPVFGGSGALLRPVIDLAAMAVGGVLLATPLLLPGLQVASRSNRTAVGPTNGPHTLPLTDVMHLVFQGFDGLPIAGSKWFGYSNYEETAAYVGVIALVMALTAVVLRWKRPEVRAFTAVVVVMGALVFLHPVVAILDQNVMKIYWVLAMTMLSFGLAVLAGMGVDVVVRSSRKTSVRQVVGIGLAAAGLVLVMMWFAGRGHLPRALATIREKSFIWPVVAVVVGLGVVWLLVRASRTVPSDGRARWGPGRTAGLCLLTVETAFLIASGAPIISSSSSPLTTPASVSALQRAVGTAVVGDGSPCFEAPRVGLLENANAAFGVHEFDAYDPMTPEAYYKQDWSNSTGVPGGVAFSSVLCPTFDTAAVARRFGVGYVLELPGFSGPSGAQYVGRVGTELLYKIPGAAAATLVPLSAGGAAPGVDAPGRPVAVTYPTPASWKVVTDSSRAEMLRLRLTDTPGWHATIDGHALTLEPFDKVMLQARIPAGSHVVTLHYWPTTFTLGIVLATGGAVGLAAMLLVGASRRRRRPLPTA